MPPTKKLASLRGPLKERHVGITWDEPNRIAHETAYPNRPPFAVAHELDWDRIKKRKDVEHKDIPERSQALVAWPISAPPPICFVAYCKVNGWLKIISIRYANEKERITFYS